LATEQRRSLARGRAIAWSVAALAVLFLLGFWFARDSRTVGVDSPKETQKASPQRSSNERPEFAVAPVIAARVRAIRGNVRSVDGRALVGARVCGLGRNEPCCVLARCAETDARGQFVLEELSGVDELFASAPGHISRRQLCSPSGEGDSENTLVLTPAGAEVVGTVVDATGGVVPGALVMGLESAGNEASLSATFSDASGKFFLPSAPGEVALTVRAEGYSQATQSVQAPARGITVVLAPGSSIRGIVIDEGSGAALPGIAVAAISERAAGAVVSAISDAEGEFQLSGLEGGVYQVEVRDIAHFAAAERVLVAVGQASANVTLRATRAAKLRLTARYEAGTPCTDLAVFLAGDGVARSEQAPGDSVEFSGLPPGTYQAEVHCADAQVHNETLQLGVSDLERRISVSRGSALSGRVERPSGEHVPGVEVNVSPVGTPLGRSASTCTSNAQGEFSCRGLGVGEHEARVYSGGEPASETVKVVLEPNRAATLLLKTAALGAIRVSVRTNGEDRPFKVFAAGEHALPREAALMGSDFVISSLPLGRYRMYIDSPPLDPAQGPFATLTRDGQVESVLLALPASEVIAGRVLDENGAPVVDAWVQVVPVDLDHDPTVANRRPAVSDQHGLFTVAGLAHGRYDVRAESSLGDADARGIVSGDRNVTVTVARHARLSGTVRVASGTAPAIFTIAYQREGGSYQQLSGRHGRWDLGSVQPGKYRVSASSLKARAAEEVLLRAGENRELTLQLSESSDPPESNGASEPIGASESPAPWQLSSERP